MINQVVEHGYDEEKGELREESEEVVENWGQVVSEAEFNGVMERVREVGRVWGGKMERLEKVSCFLSVFAVRAYVLLKSMSAS